MKNSFLNIMMKVLVILIAIAGIVFGAFIYSTAKEDTEETCKIESEIDYLDTKITSLINKLNGINLQNYKISISKVEEKQGQSNSDSSEKENSKSEQAGENDESKEETTITKMEEEKVVADEEKIEWDWIQGETELIYSSWGAIVLDLYDIGIPSEKIVGFSNTLDQALIAIKNHDKPMAAGFLAKLYNFLSDFASISDIKEMKKSTIKAKNHIMNAYAYVQDELWDRVQAEVVNAEDDFKKIINDVGNSEDKGKHNINKTYMLIGELKNSLATKDKEIFYLKYKNLLEELNTLL